MGTVLAADRLVVGDDVLTDGWVEIEDDRVAAVGSGRRGSAEHVGSWLLPGFIDTHVHGAGGASFATTDPDEAQTAAAALRACGSTTALASLVSDELDIMCAQIETLAGLAASAVIGGIHLEGPFLSPARAGAHAPSTLREPTAEAVDRLVRAGGGAVRMVTLAPEVPGGLEAAARFTAAGVIVAFGHSAADAATTRAALDAGARVATHLFNAMSPIGHRVPGPVPLLLTDPRVSVELICDGVHVHPEVLRMAVAAAGTDRVMVVSDALAACAAEDGDFPLGGLNVRVQGGRARVLNGDGSLGAIAGSVCTQAEAAEILVGRVGCTLPDVARMAAATPARVHGLDDVGALVPGRLADAVVAEESGRVTRVLSRGTWLE